MVNPCLGCLSKSDEIIFLREMVKNLTEKQATLMTETLVPKVQEPVSYSPMLIDEFGKIIKVDEEARPEIELSDAEIVNHIVGH